MCALDSYGECRIEKIEANPDVMQNIETLGLVPGTRLKILSSSKNGCIIEVKGSRLAIDASLAKDIKVVSVEPYCHRLRPAFS